MNAKLFLLSVIFLLNACQSKVDTALTTDAVLSEDTLVRVLIDVHMLENTILAHNFSKDSNILLYEIKDERIWKKYNITESRFRTSMVNYAASPQKIDAIYARVLDSLNTISTTGKYSY
ncbi:MAG: DUF4296 domain-containing protein [Cytophagaceae bacterium]|jgi:hypothetical protein|nr:DUF4296 domain-containing protein [Cytophagaceae bacterium]